MQEKFSFLWSEKFWLALIPAVNIAILSIANVDISGALTTIINAVFLIGYAISEILEKFKDRD